MHHPLPYRHKVKTIRNSSPLSLSPKTVTISLKSVARQPTAVTERGSISEGQNSEISRGCPSTADCNQAPVPYHHCPVSALAVPMQQLAGKRPLED